jgi:hypothetical protein
MYNFHDFGADVKELTDAEYQCLPPKGKRVAKVFRFFFVNIIIIMRNISYQYKLYIYIYIYLKKYLYKTGRSAPYQAHASRGECAFKKCRRGAPGGFWSHT